MGPQISPTLDHHAPTYSKLNLNLNLNGQNTFTDKAVTFHSEMIPAQLLPRPEELLPFLKAARHIAKDRYQELHYARVRDALCEVFDNCTEWLEDGIEPSVILLEALQDERAILDRQNRIQARTSPGGSSPRIIPDRLANFPLRFMCLRDGDFILPPDLFEPEHEAKKTSMSPVPAFTKMSAAHNYSIGKLSDAPSPTHDFPDGNFTLAEIAAFLPQSIKSWDVADRILWNGASSEDLAVMFNSYRGLNAKISINTVYLMFRGQMRKRTNAEHGYEKWDKWIVSAQADIKKPAGFDANSISVSGFRRPVVFENRPNVPAVPVSFKNLAKGVAVWPEGHDALDLTRCVRWCVDHPERTFFYPTDYEAVLRHAGGSLTPDARHSDAAALARIRSGTSRLGPRRRAAKDYSHRNAASDEGSDGTRLEKRKRGPYFREEHAKRLKSALVSPHQIRAARNGGGTPRAKRITQLEVDSEEDTDDDMYQGPKPTKKGRREPRRSGRIKSKAASYIDGDGVDSGEGDD